MCNFMGVKVTKLQFIQLNKIEKELGTLAAMNELAIIKDGFSYSNSAIIKKTAENDFSLFAAHWEFIPIWIKNMEEVQAARKQGIPWLNARSEKLLESKMFRHAALNRRCLVLASHFFEWRHFKPEGEKKSNAYPYKIELNNADYFYMAGIWQPFVDKSTGETFDSFAIVTTEANELMQAVHNTKKRMPTILPDDLAWKWISDGLTENEIKQIATFQFPSSEMKASSIIKSFKNALDPLEECDYPELPHILL